MAGLIYGLTGENHLDELETCLKVSDDLVNEAKKIIGEFSAKEVIHAIEDIGTLASMLPPALTTCKDMDEDIAKIEAWAQIWTHPAHLLERVGKNWILYHFQLHHDMKAISADWKNGDYFMSGEDTGDFLSKIFTPGMPVKAVPEFIGGFMYKFVGDNNMEQIEGCAKNGDKMVNQIETAIADFRKGGKVNIIRGIDALKNVVSEFPQELSTCKAMG